MERSSQLIALHDIVVKFAAKTVLDQVTFKINLGKITTIIGPNGAGKSTLVKLILGLIAPTSGIISRVPDLKVGYVPQNFNISSLMPVSVLRFLQLGTSNKQVIQEVMATLSIDYLESTMLQNLSGGELQRVLLAKAMLQQPNLLVLDEPTQGVDVNGQLELYNLIGKIRASEGCAILMVSHDLHLVMAGTDDVICLNHHICCAGHPETVRQHPEFINLFGKNLVPYSHQHNHDHNLQGKMTDSGSLGREQ